MKFLISVFFMIVSIYAKVVDKIDVIVNNIPITSYDIIKTENELNMNKNEAISYLINNAVLESVIKQRGIYVDDFDVDNEMQKIANKNGMSLFDFKNYLLSKGKLKSFQKQVKLNLQKQKLLQTLNINVDENEIKNYYNLHKKEFLLPTKIEVTQYSSKNKNDLVAVLKNPLSQNTNVKIEDKIFDKNTTNPRLMQFLNQTKDDSFTPIVRIEDKFISFYIMKKSTLKPLPYKVVQAEIYQKLLKEKEQQTLQDFILKEKAKADIKFLTKIN